MSDSVNHPAHYPPFISAEEKMADEPPSNFSDVEDAWLKEQAAYYCVSVDEMRAFIEGDDEC